MSVASPKLERPLTPTSPDRFVLLGSGEAHGPGTPRESTRARSPAHGGVYFAGSVRTAAPHLDPANERRPNDHGDRT
jgi:hypothetical protein